jgi:formylglycine-generating enzyme required for sulfatase activity
MHRTVGILTAALLAGGLCVLAADEPAGKDRILKLFVDELVELKPGQGKFPASFRMGTAEGPASEKPVVPITFKQPFSIARYEVTQELYQAVRGNNPARWRGPRNSVEMVTWADANDFCKKLTQELRQRKLIPENAVLRLPSEAEWEYACRAGTTTAFSFGDKADDLGQYAWYKANSKGEDPPVGRKKPNAWGLYDMHGYVSEWCADAWAPTLEGTPLDGSPRQAKDAKERVMRGGSFADPPDELRCAFRSGKPAEFKSDRIGFRCVMALDPKKE